MAGYEKDEASALLDSLPKSSDRNVDSRLQMFTSRTRSASMPIPTNSMESYEPEADLVGHTRSLQNERTLFIPMSDPLYIRKPENIFLTNQGVTDLKRGERQAERFPSYCGTNQNDWLNDSYAAKNEHLLRSGQLGMCDDPYCTTCPGYYKATQPKQLKGSNIFDAKFNNALYGDAKGWARRFISSLRSFVPGIMNPYVKILQQWNKFFIVSCLVSIFVDLFFFFLLSVQKDNKCIVINWSLTTTIVVFRSITDIVYFLNMLLQFRLAYVAPESRVVGAGELVDHPKKIALNYLRRYFFIDLYVVLPLPQIIILFVSPKSLGLSGANYPENLFPAVIIVQNFARLCRLLPLFASRSPDFLFLSAWENYCFNPLIFIFCGHFVGSCWYLFGLQRVNHCLRDACHKSSIAKYCMKFIDCVQGDEIGKYKDHQTWLSWANNTNAIACFNKDGDFPYGIYQQAVNLTTKSSIITRYVYSLFWGFQQISTLAGNQIPGYFVGEVLLTMAIILAGLLLFARFIGNMQSVFQDSVQRRLDMILGLRDVEEWMSYRQLPEDLRRQVREAERYRRATTRGVNEETFLEKLPEDLQRDIRRHLFKFVKKLRIFALMDEPILDAICERLRQKTYLRGSEILQQGGLIEKMVFIVRGKMESIGEDGDRVPLSEGDVCGEELLTWCLEHSSVNRDEKKISVSRRQLLSKRMVRCLTTVEAFSLRAADLEEVASLFARFLRNPCVQGAIRYESPYWRSLAATRIQVAWRYKKKRLSRAGTSQSNYSSK